MACTHRDSGLQWVSDHAQDRWRDRAERPGGNLRAVWHEATAIDYPSAYQDAYARYHHPTNLVLLARWGELVTCIDLDDRPLREQQHVFSQLED